MQGKSLSSFKLVSQDESRLDSLPEDGSTEVTNILKQEEEDFALPGTGPSNNHQFEIQ